MFRGTSALLLIAALSSAGEAQPSMSDLDLQAPAQLTLGDADSVDISARSPDGSPLRFSTNVGSIGEVQMRGERAHATYTPPTARFPQVAIVVVTTADHALVDWTRIELHGTPTVRFSFEASSRVMVRVRDREFGPVRTNHAGNGEVELIVPPGVQIAEAHGTDRLGNTRTEPIELAPPPFDRGHLVCVPDVGGLLFAVDESGAPAAPNDTIRSSAELEETVLQPGVVSIRADVAESNVERETVELSATLGDESERCTTTIQRLPPEHLEISLSSDAAREGTSIDVEIALGYGDGAHLVVAPTLEVGVGTTSEPRLVRNGVYTARWTLPESTDAREGTVRASVGDARAHATIELFGERGPVGIGLGVGVLANFGRIRAPYIALNLHYALSLDRSNALLLGLTTGFWLASDTQLDQTGSETIDLGILAVPVLARIGYRRAFGSIDLFATVDVGALIVRHELESTPTGEVSETRATWALGATVGASLQLGPGRLGLELGYRHATIDGEVEGRAAGLHVALGYTFEVP